MPRRTLHALCIASFAVNAAAIIDITTGISGVDWRILVAPTQSVTDPLLGTSTFPLCSRANPSDCPIARDLVLLQNNLLPSGWISPPTDNPAMWLGSSDGNGLGGNGGPLGVGFTTYMLEMTMSAAEVSCVTIDAMLAADDTLSISINGERDWTLVNPYTHPCVDTFSDTTCHVGPVSIGNIGSFTPLETAISDGFRVGSNVLYMTNDNSGAGAGGVLLYGALNTLCPPQPPNMPPPNPPSVPPTIVAVMRDPHLYFAHGGRADLRGEDHTWYNLLSAKNASVNVLFDHADFHNPYKLVHGSRMSQFGMVLRTALSGRVVMIDFNASATGVQRARVKTPAGDQWIDHSSEPLVYENIKAVMREKKMGASGHGMSLTINDGRWEIQVWSKRFPNPAANPGKAMLNVGIAAKYDADHDVVAPHGLVGQSYDGDGIAIDGATDDYTGKEITTKAMAEGAIEGTAADYKMRGVFDLDFKFARFDATAAKPRDVTKLIGRKKSVTNKEDFGVGALPDLE